MPHLHPCLHQLCATTKQPILHLHTHTQFCPCTSASAQAPLQCLHLCCCNTFVQKHGEFTLINATFVNHCPIKMINSLLNTFPKYMENSVLLQPEHPCIVDPVRNTLKHPELNAKRDGEVSKVKKITYHDLLSTSSAAVNDLKHVTSSLPSMQYNIFPNFQQPIRDQVSSKSDVSSKHQAQIIVVLTLDFITHQFSTTKNAPSEIQILALVSTAPCAKHTTTKRSSFIWGSQINPIVQPNSRGTFPTILPPHSTIQHCPSPNLPFHTSTQLL